jgi:hypothetical protein
LERLDGIHDNSGDSWAVERPESFDGARVHLGGAPAMKSLEGEHKHPGAGLLMDCALCSKQAVNQAPVLKKADFQQQERRLDEPSIENEESPIVEQNTSIEGPSVVSPLMVCFLNMGNSKQPLALSPTPGRVDEGGRYGLPLDETRFWADGPDCSAAEAVQEAENVPEVVQPECYTSQARTALGLQIEANGTTTG